MASIEFLLRDGSETSLYLMSDLKGPLQKGGEVEQGPNVVINPDARPRFRSAVVNLLTRLCDAPGASALASIAPQALPVGRYDLTWEIDGDACL